ncbi:MAG TPA: hypothetical protein DFL85_01270 [Lentisphaeria bacterium]|nr:hypothetical protein C5Q97_04845 [Victivallales bacterium CCUG 44730]HCH84124.1 hypothetical protein [Lentisphaeria bacterium]
MDAGQNKNQRMEFRRIGGSYQQVIRTAADLRLLLSLDEAHWALNSVSVDSVRSDEQFLAFLDDDMNRQIRTDEVKRAVGWFLGMMNDFSGFEAESDVLELSAIDAASPEGARLLDAAKLVLSNIGRETDGRLSLAQIRNDKEIIACARQNGDGIIPPGAADTPETAELVNSAMKLFGSIKDICGAEGIDSAILDQFTAAATAYVNWVDAPAANPAALKPFGDDTAASYGKFSALEKELDDYFIACEARVFSREAPDRLRKVESTIDLLNNQAIRDFFASAPVAEPRPDETLDFSAKLNPLKRDALLAFAADAHIGEFLVGNTLSNDNWKKLKARFAPYAAWVAAKPNSTFDGYDLDSLRRQTAPETVAALRGMIAADLAVAPRIGACEQLLKLILFQRYLLEFLNNFVNLSQLFTPGTSSLLQAGMLVMDGRNFTLVSIVKNVAEHKAIVRLSDICVIYLDASTGKPDAQKTMKLAVAVTSGNIRNLFINKHGIFFSADGELWDAKIIDLVQQPVSISEALRMPFYKFGEFIGNQADRFFSARSQEAQKQLETNFNAAATAATAPQAAAAPKMQTPAVSGSMLLMGGGIGIAALGSSIAFIVKQLANVSIWNVLAVLLGIILIFGGPVVAVSLVKLYRRNLSRFLEANGYAVNRPMRLSRRMGAIFTFVPPIPNSNYIRRDLVDLFNKPSRSSKIVKILCIVLFVLLCAAAGYWCYNRFFAPKSAPVPAVPAAPVKPSPAPSQPEAPKQ